MNWKVLSLCAFLACVIGTAQAEEPIKVIGEYGYVWADLEKGVMPLVDEHALDNKPEHVLQHGAGLYTKEHDVIVFILVGLNKEETNRELGKLLKPTYAPKPTTRFIVTVPQGYVLLGKYKLLRNESNPRGLYHCRVSSDYSGGFGYTKRWRISSW